MRKDTSDAIKEKLTQIKKLTREVEQLMTRGDRFIVRAATGEKSGYVDLFDPINATTNVIAAFNLESFEPDFKNLSRGIFQAIKAIPITAIGPGSFDLYISHLDDWKLSDAEIGEGSATIRAHMLAIFDQYSVEPQLLFQDEIEEMEDEYDTLYNSGEHNGSETTT